MIAIDTNLLVYAHREDSPFCSAARACLTRLVTSASRWAIPWPCVVEFVGIVTHPKVYRPPTPLPRALDALDVWMGVPGLVLLAETPDHWQTLRQQLLEGHVAGPLVHDCKIAALCIAHGVRELWSSDRDFSRFPTLRVRNPLGPR